MRHAYHFLYQYVEHYFIIVQREVWWNTTIILSKFIQDQFTSAWVQRLLPSTSSAYRVTEREGQKNETKIRQTIFIILKWIQWRGIIPISFPNSRISIQDDQGKLNFKVLAYFITMIETKRVLKKIKIILRSRNTRENSKILK